MREVFVDTSGWVALKHKGDTFWQAATTLHRALLTAGARYVTSNFVLDESYTLLLHRAGHHVAVESIGNTKPLFTRIPPPVPPRALPAPPRATGTTPRRTSRASGWPALDAAGRPPARAVGHGQDGWLVTGSWGCSEAIPDGILSDE